MPKFFTEQKIEDTITLTGQTASHISKSLRMKVGEEVVLCDGKGWDYGCIITAVSKESVELKLAFKTKSESEAAVKIEVFQGLPKGDKLSEVVRRCTELGAFAFHPVIMKRSVSRPDEKSAKKKVERLRKISSEAAEQSRRGIIPEVFEIESFESALKENRCEKTILFYENGGRRLKDILDEYNREGVESIALIIGPEGGFDESEVDAAKALGAEVATLGKRILRTETAPVAACANVIYELDKF